MYQYQPERKNKIASALLLIFALAAIILLGLSVIFNAFVGILQLAAVLCLVVEVALFSKYFRRSYVYRIQSFNKSNDAPDFLVSEISGKDSIVVCRLSLENLLSIEKSTSKTRKNLGKYYNYCVDIAPKNAYILRFEENYEKITLIISPDETMLSIFENYAEKNSQQNED